MARLIFLCALPAFIIGCDSKDDTGDSGTTTTGTGTGANTGTGTGTTGTGTGTTGTGTGATGTGTGSTGPFDLTLTGTSYDPHDTQTMWFSLWEVPAYTQVGSTTTITQSGGDINEVWAGALEKGKTYTVAWAADFDDSGDCDMAYDHGWSEPIDAVTGPVTINRDHDDTFDGNVCGLF